MVTEKGEEKNEPFLEKVTSELLFKADAMSQEIV